MADQISDAERAHAIWQRYPDITEEERLFVAEVLRSLADSMTEQDWFKFNAMYAAGELGSHD